MSLSARKAVEPVEDISSREHWISAVERCADGWMFSVVGLDDEIETFIHLSQHSAECARAELLRTRCPAVSIVCTH